MRQSKAAEQDEDGLSEHRHFWSLVLGSIGVVFGDIGTSPLYALREAVNSAQGVGISNREGVVGVLSMILWALTLIVTIKYVMVLLRIDNKGEGGTFALMSLGQSVAKRSAPIVLWLGIAGAAFFYGDAVITPAISVLSAVEGLNLITPAFEKFVLPISLLILVALFSMQSHGTAKVANVFGPVTAIWFVAIAVGGLIHLVDDPSVLAALNPVAGIEFAASHGIIGLKVMGLVFLSVTGAEALYADLGHFGRRPISFAWMWLVFPSLALNYLGQGALVLSNSAALENPFFRLYPQWALFPMIVLATLATVIASQAVITGAFSLTRQAVQLGLVPRLAVHHTSEAMAGQIYLPRINWLLLISVLFVVIVFRDFEPSRLCLRRIRHCHYGHHLMHGVFCYLEAMGLERLASRCSHTSARANRASVLYGQHPQDSGWWMVALGDSRQCWTGHCNLDQGGTPRPKRIPKERGRTRLAHQKARGKASFPCFRNGSVSYP